MPQSNSNAPIIIATRGSALALTQSRYVQARFQEMLPELSFKIEIFKTKGDQLQSMRPEEIPSKLPKGLFTKELETALLDGRADLAVHSLKDLPTELPAGLKIAAVSPREDVREVLLTKAPLRLAAPTENAFTQLAKQFVIATGSPRRQAFIHRANPSLQTVPIRGNVPTRIRKLAESDELDGIILAAAGLKRLGYQLHADQPVSGNDVPDSIFATILPVRDMIPCVGQGAIGLETRSEDSRIEAVCQRFNDESTDVCTTTERTFLRAMGGGCQSPIAACATIKEDALHLIAANFGDGKTAILEDTVPRQEGPKLAESFANQLK